MSEFLRIVRMMRYCWIGGRYGGGKTTLALHLADLLIRGGVVTKLAVNMPLFIGIDPVTTTRQSDVTDLRSACIVLDEAGQYLDVQASPAKFRSWFLALRKREQVVLMPSVFPVHRLAQRVRAQRVFNGLQLGIPVWLYRWRYSMGEISDKGFYAWWNPDRIFGVFDTEYEPDDRWFIYDFADQYSAACVEEADAVQLGKSAGVV